MKSHIALLFLLITCHHNLIYSEDYALNGVSWQKDGRSIALGGGISGLETTTSSMLSVNYHLPYHLSELSTRSIKGTFCTRWMDLNGIWSQTGDAVFMENYLALGASRNLSGSFMLGVKAGLYHYALISGNKGSMLVSEILCKYRPYEKMQMNIYLFNPTGTKIKKAENNIRMYQSFHLGGSFFPTQKTEWLIEIEKIQQENLIWHLGFEYTALETFIIRTGLSAQPLKPSWGIGGHLHHIRYALGGNLHPVLGFSSCFSLYYNW